MDAKTTPQGVIIASEFTIQAWIIDDTGYPKKGKHSVGVARQYCGQVGKQDNCRVMVRLSVATYQGSLPVAYRLYLPKDWADDPVRRAKVGVPDDVTSQTKPRDRVAADAPGPGRRRAASRGVGRSGIWQRRQVSSWHRGTWAAIRGRYYALHDGLAARRGAVAAGAQVAPRPTREAVAPRQDASAGLGQGAGLELPLCLAADHLARGDQSVLASRFARLRVRGAHGDARRQNPQPKNGY